MPKEHQRPSPEKLLLRAKKEEQQSQRGKLKIYLGAAPGVGKTYTMLEDALAKRAQGLDIVVGIVESHGRKEVENFLHKLDILPRQKVSYHGQEITEFDLDGVFKRNPAVILIDEMAHTNVPGLRHAKRWQDIKEILDRGIDVYTTLNVQHIESLNDIVTQIIHTRIKETVPDSMIELADSVELVDLPAEDLLKRLEEGKIYIPQQVSLASEHFFRRGNLSALRELALRVTAERVGEQVLSYRQGQGIQFIWPTKEKLLVCVGADTNASKLIRAAKRLAETLHAEWVAVHIDTGMSQEKRNLAIQHLRLAEQLGAQTRILSGMDLTKEIINCARDNNITKIVLGKHLRPFWKNILRDSLTDRVVRHSGEIDIYMITYEVTQVNQPKPATPTKRIIPWGTYAFAIGIVALTTLIGFLLAQFLHATNIIMLYFITITIVALFGRLGPSVLASILSVVAYDYFFINPTHHLFINDSRHFLTLLVMLLVAQTISHLTILLRRQAEAAHLAEQRTSTLHALSRQLASTRGVDKLLDSAVTYIASVFNSEVLALLYENNQLLVSSGYGSKLMLNEKEQSVAQWVFDLGQIAGLGTDTLPFSDALYVPLLSSKKSIGVLRVHPINPEQLFTPEQTHLLEACANQVALAIEVDRLHEQSKESELQSETDRVRGALLESVSHDLRTPLAAAMGSASTLMEIGNELDVRTIKKLAADIYYELEELNRLINNLLQISYLEAESVHLEREEYPINEIINIILNTAGKKLEKNRITVNMPENLPNIPIDKTLIQDVFTNLIDNAIKFTPKNSKIEISAKVTYDQVVVSIEDQGPGIASDEVDKLFEKFYRGRLLTSERGLGLGLAICRSIIEAHGGKIWAENRKNGHGAVFRFALPVHL